jgi:tetratricopeptide (TPR) repeat protein
MEARVADQKKKKSSSKTEEKKVPAAPATDAGWLEPTSTDENPFAGELDLSEVDALFSKAETLEGDVPTDEPVEETLAGAEAELTPPPPAPPRAAATPESEVGSVLDDKNSFRAQAQKLARSGDWAGLAALTTAALDVSKWATQPEIRAALLADLARMYRDRLRDLPSAEDQFRRLVEVTPANADANRFLAQRYREREDWNALYELREKAVEASWDPNQRLEWTKEAASVANEKLRSEDLAIQAWERLWRLGDAEDEAARALSEAYRRGEHWDRLATFLAKRAEPKTGAERLMALREVAEAYLSGVRDHDSAAQVLQQILDERPQDPVALLSQARVLARRKDWAALTELGTRRFEGLSNPVVTDIRRLAADALGSADEWARSAEVYEQILAVEPRDPDALKAKEEHLQRQQKLDSLIELLSKRAESAPEEERARLYDRAATIAEKELSDLKLTVSLLEKRAEIESVRSETLQQLANLYEQLGDHEGVRRTLEKLVELTQNPRARIDLLRRLGEHCAHKLGDDARSEKCWREILDAVPDDAAIREELTALHRRRGDWEAVDRSLAAQAWRSLDDEALATVWRAAAVNLQENMNDPARTLRAWRRVLDVKPDDTAALRAQVVHARALGRKRELIDALEAVYSASDGEQPRVEQALEIATLWEAEGDRAAALAAFERVLRLDPTERTALAAVTRLRGAGEAGASRGALDLAAAHLDGDERRAVVRQLLTLVGDDANERVSVLRRLLGLGGPMASLMGELAEVATKSGAHAALAAVYEEVAAGPDGEAREEAYAKLAALCEGPLGQPVRAFLIQQAARQRPVTTLDELEPLLKLAEAAGRHEDAVALCGIAAWSEAPLETRRAALRRRMALCEQKLGDPKRAFDEVARLVRLDPHDAQAFADAQRLAAAAGRFADLDALWAERWDRAENDSERVEIARARAKLHAGELKDPLGALDHGVVAYRLQPTRELEDELEKQADALDAWDRVLPVLEARARTATMVSPSALSHLGALHEQKRRDPRRAFELFGQALLLEPSAKETEQKAASLAGDDAERLAGLLRAAAAHSSDPMRALELYGRAAALFADKLKRADLALDVHQRILQLQPAALDSLEVVLAHHRAAGNWRELRDSLSRWLELDATKGDPRRRERLLEIASLSRDKLADYEGALSTYTQILDGDPQDAQALEGIQSLTKGEMEPTLELKRLRIELQRAAGARRVDLQLACAELQEKRLDDLPGAVATLRELQAESGAAGVGYDPLARLLTRSGAWAELVELMEARAAALAESRARAEVLERAIALAEEHREVPAELRERLYRALLQLKPEHVATRQQLLRLYRAHGRYDELEKLLAATETRLAGSELSWLLGSERARVLDRMLDKSPEAEALLAERLKAEPGHREALAALASLKQRRGDREGWLKLRADEAKLLPPRLGALVLCHLAELADETTHDNEKVLAHYRAARALDPENKPAMEALKALGRRVRTWRAHAALLQDPDEAQLSSVDRATRLYEKAQATEKSDPQIALDLYERAVAVNPDDAAAWDGLAALHERLGDKEGALFARRAALGAFERVTAPEPVWLATHAFRLQELAAASRAAGQEANALGYSMYAWELDPHLAPAALAVADARLAQGATAEAQAIYSAVLSRGKLTEAERRHASFRRGVLAQREGRLEEAIADLREGLRVAPLDPGLLQALADVLAAKGRVAAAVQHHLQALLLASEPRTRGPLYARLGNLWETQLGNTDEAGVSYDLAIGCGYDAPDIMLRALQHYRRSGQKERAARVIEVLLPRTTAPAELATLWAERGCLLADTDGGKAMEAFDMALSYDPASRPAVDGLAQLLERRGEWQQLMEFLEVRVDSGTLDARVATLRQLGRIAEDHLRDSERAKQYLQAVIALQPEVEDYDRLLTIVGDAPGTEEERREILAHRLALAGPWMAYLTEFGRQLAADGQRGWAWCLLSPLMNAMIQDPAVKSLVLELRKEFDKADNVPALAPDLHQRVLHPALPAPLYDVLIELDKVAPLGPRTPEEAGAGRGSRLDARVALGKTFQAIAERLGMPDAILTRTEELPAPYRVLQSEVPHIVARMDLFAVMSLQETNALFTLMLEQARPGARLLAMNDAQSLVSSLLAAVGLRPRDGEPLVDAIVGATSEPQRAAWNRALADPSVQVVPEKAHEGMMETARRVALIAAGELRFAAKIFSRLEEGAPKLPTAGRIEDLDAFVGASATVRNAIAFAASPRFGALLGR